MGRVRVLERVAQESGTIGKFEKYRKVRSLAENNKEPRAVSENFDVPDPATANRVNKMQNGRHKTDCMDCKT